MLENKGNVSVCSACKTDKSSEGTDFKKPFTFKSSSTGKTPFTFKSSTTSSSGSGFTFKPSAGGKTFGNIAQSGTTSSGFGSGSIDLKAAKFSTSPAKKDMKEVESKTGEEDEVTVAEVLTKIYRFEKDDKGSGWKEGGKGDLRVNKLEGKDGKKSARLIMRTDKTLRVILNVPIFKEMTVERADEKLVKVISVMEGKPAIYQMRFKTVEAADTFFKAVQTCITFLG